MDRLKRGRAANDPRGRDASSVAATAHGNPSARAGADQAERSEGARDGGAVRRSKCHAGTQSGGRDKAPLNWGETPVSSRSAPGGTLRKSAIATNWAAWTFSELPDEADSPCSTTSQLSSAHGSGSTQHPESVASCDATSSTPAASSMQCFVTGSQTASRSKATKRRNRFTPTGSFEHRGLSSDAAWQRSTACPGWDVVSPSGR